MAEVNQSVSVPILSSLETAKKVLRDHEDPFPLQDLPNDRNDPLWGQIQDTYKLSLSQLSALKNHCCVVNLSVVAVSDVPPTVVSQENNSGVSSKRKLEEDVVDSQQRSKINKDSIDVTNISSSSEMKTLPTLASTEIIKKETSTNVSTIDMKNQKLPVTTNTPTPTVLVTKSTIPIIKSNPTPTLATNKNNNNIIQTKYSTTTNYNKPSNIFKGNNNNNNNITGGSKSYPKPNQTSGQGNNMNTTTTKSVTSSNKTTDSSGNGTIRKSVSTASSRYIPKLIPVPTSHYGSQIGSSWNQNQTQPNKQQDFVNFNGPTNVMGYTNATAMGYMSQGQGPEGTGWSTGGMFGPGAAGMGMGMGNDWGQVLYIFLHSSQPQ